MEPSNSRTELRPGDACEKSGAFMVIHEGHRDPHEVIVLAGEVFPACKRCGEAVRFRPTMTGTRSRIAASASGEL